ncbi:MAG: hypothetical protein L0Y44_01735 [Phycisphaerales bacterium]|nr:hypothetical protein [Phycisphaerales bacterium]MCI0629357.1 hypothetical protein [Phycisphaerales bacterium]MCI0674336.1 hypothetical protein [Phycisphaerales bacterium]
MKDNRMLKAIVLFLTFLMGGLAAVHYARTDTSQWSAEVRPMYWVGKRGSSMSERTMTEMWGIGVAPRTIAITGYVSAVIGAVGMGAIISNRWILIERKP